VTFAIPPPSPPDVLPAMVVRMIVALALPLMAALRIPPPLVMPSAVLPVIALSLIVSAPWL